MFVQLYKIFPKYCQKIGNNLAPVAGLIFLPVTLLENETPEPVEKKYILRIWCAELIELAAYNLQRITADRQEYILCSLRFLPLYAVLSDR